MITALDERTALILIDLQKAITQRPIPAMPVVVKNAAALAAAFRKASLPVIVVNVNPANAKWTSSRKDTQATATVADPEGIAITPEINVQSSDILITKHTWGAFFETGLHEILQKLRVTGIVLAGVATSIGVEGTARQASELAYNLSFAEDAMTDAFPEAHAHSLKYIFPRIGEVGTTAGIIEKLSSAAAG
ncbi:MAG TPA: cysteine hydrolase [Chitinophagaceae bacterium]|nr:cysteine hydrolase [Chitinophagaceae bacterium]